MTGAVLRATMATSPRYVFVREPMLSEGQPAAWNFIRLALQRDYISAFQRRAGASILIGYARKWLMRRSIDARAALLAGEVVVAAWAQGPMQPLRP